MDDASSMAGGSEISSTLSYVAAAQMQSDGMIMWWAAPLVHLTFFDAEKVRRQFWATNPDSGISWSKKNNHNLDSCRDLSIIFAFPKPLTTPKALEESLTICRAYLSCGAPEFSMLQKIILDSLLIRKIHEAQKSICS